MKVRILHNKSGEILSFQELSGVLPELSFSPKADQVSQDIEVPQELESLFSSKQSDIAECVRVDVSHSETRLIRIRN